MDNQRPTWELLLETAKNLARGGRSPFSLDSLIRGVQALDPQRERSSISPIVQGMTANAPGGPVSACGEVFRRVERGMYELLPEPAVEMGLVRAHDTEASALLPPLPSPGDTGATVLYMRAVHDALVKRGEIHEIVSARDQVLERYRPVFEPSNLEVLTEDEFKGFLLFKNNRHWDGIHRQGTRIVEDMERLRAALGILLDESSPISQRLDELIRDDGPNYVPGLGKAVLTPILLVVYPDTYGVWNNIAEGGMRRLGLFPDFEPGSGFGARYEAVNRVLGELAVAIGTDLWTLDSLWWAVEEKIGPGADGPVDSMRVEDADQFVTDRARFGLERHLHEFLRDNWDQTELAGEWTLHEEDGELAGYEYPTDVGRVDLLARHRSEPRWLVIELKRNQSDDTTVGQLTRYMGWIKENLAAEDDAVEGMVISATGGERIRYALSMVPNASLRTYEVEFRLIPTTPSSTTSAARTSPPGRGSPSAR